MKSSPSSKKILLNNLSIIKQQSSPISTPQFTSPQTHLAQDKDQFLFQTYSVIKAQQKHIEKLQKDNIRKDALIANLLTKNQVIRTKREQIQKIQIQSLQMDKIVNGMSQLRSQYQFVIQQNQSYKNQIEIKNREIKKCIKTIKQYQIYQQDLEYQIEECKNTAQKMRQAYQAKIAKLLAQMRKNVQTEVLRTKQKRLLTEQNQIQDYNQYINHKKFNQNKQKNQFKIISQSSIKKFKQFNQQNPQNKLYTPIKITNGHEIPTNQQAISRQFSKNTNSTTIQTDNKKQINTPYKICNNFVTSEYKNFPSNNLIRLDVPDSFRQKQINKEQNKINDNINKSNKKNYSKILSSVQDVEFMTDSYSYENNSNEEEFNEEVSDSFNSNKSQYRKNNPKINPKQNKISIQKVIQQFNKYNKSQTNSSHSLSQEQIQPSSLSYIRQVKNQRKSLNITHILNTLSQKIKYFQSESIEKV